MPPSQRIKKSYVLLPVAGALLFVVLYVVAAGLYPGGSQADANSHGFSWTDNYWCNLLGSKGINGQHNPGQPVAIAASVALCGTLSCFWWWLPQYLGLNKSMRLATRWAGVLSMATAFLLFTPLHHDAVINIAGMFGLVALAGTFAGLYRAGWYVLFGWGWLNLLLVGLNNYLYYNKGLMGWLPLVQKLTFAAFLAWICCICICIHRRIGH